MERQLPNFRSYGNYSSDNYDVNSLVFSDGKGNEFYFSYQTMIAFYSHKTGLVIRENVWGVTTGKHLNWIDGDKSKRLTGDEFEKKYKEIFGN